MEGTLSGPITVKQINLSSAVIGQNGSECFGRDEEFGELMLEFAHQ